MFIFDIPVIFLERKGYLPLTGLIPTTCMVIYVCCCHPPPLAHLFPPSVCPTCWCVFGDRCRPSRANMYFNSLIFSSIRLKYSHSMCSVSGIISNRFHSILPVWNVWTYFHMLWTVLDRKPTAAHYRQTLVVWRYFRCRAVICHTPPLLPLYNLFTAISLLWHHPPNPVKRRYK